MNEDLSSIQGWLDSNCLSINVTKSTFLHIRPNNNSPYVTDGLLAIQNEPIVRSGCAKFLGVMIDDNLSGDAHIAQLRPKLAGAIAGICRVRKILETESCLLLYHAFFSSNMAYGLEYFGLNYANRILPLLILQKRALRCIFRVPPLESSRPIFVSCKILPFPLYIEYILCIQIYKIIQGVNPNICRLMRSGNNTRGGSSNLLILAPCVKNVGRNTFAVRGSLMWNVLPESIRAQKSSLSQFKSLLKEFLLNKFACQ
jgi:hypothetical protein